MRGLSGIVGQPHAIARLRAALAAGRPHHAYLFDGPDGVGKRTAAIALAQAMACEARPGDGCGECDPCRKIADGLHPDLIVFEVLPEKGQTERVRELLPRLAFAPHEARARIVVIEPADELNLAAANALLKTLEEPPPRTHFVLVTARASSLLPTIRSRCLQVRFAALDDETVERELLRQGVEASAATAAAGLAGGSLGRALSLTSSDEIAQRRQRVARLLQAARLGDAQSALDAAAEVAGDRDEAEATLDLLWLTYRDAVLVASGLADGRVAEARRAAANALGRAPSSLLTGLHAVEEAREAVRGYVSPQLAVEHLLLRLAQAGAA